MSKFPKINQWLLESENDKITVLYPGGFKPMTGGHLDLITRYSQDPEVKEVRVIVGPKTRNGIDQDLGVKIAEELTSHLPNVKIEKSKFPSPLLTAYKEIENLKPGKYALGASSKGDDYKRVVNFTAEHQPGGKYTEGVPEGVSIVELPVNADPALFMNGPHKGQPISASTLRSDIMDGNFEGFASGYPLNDEKQIKKVWDMLQGVVVNESLSNGIGMLNVESYKDDEIWYVDFNDALVPLKNEFIQEIGPKNLNKYLGVKAKWDVIEWDGLAKRSEEKYRVVGLNESYSYGYINEAVVPKVNKHMTHAEDLVILSGKEGMDWVLKMMWDLYQDLKGNTEKQDMKLSVKIDGAPAIFAWSKFSGLPDNGIGMKGLFAKNPKIYTTPEEVDAEQGERPDLAYKLKTFLKHLPEINVPEGEIWQGDFLFDDKSIQETEIDGDQYWAFHPNTIYYVIKRDSDLGKLIDKAEVGITWHTRYTGSSLADIQANYDVDVSELKMSDRILMTDPYIKSFAGTINFTEEESEDIEQTIEDLVQISQNLSNSQFYKELLESKNIISLFTIFQNTLIKSEVNVGRMDPDKFIEEFIEFIQNRGAKEAEKLKSEKGKEKKLQKYAEMIDFIQQNKDEMYMIVHMIMEITRLKEMFVKKLNHIGDFQSYLKMKEGKLRSTNQEGFAVSDIDGNVVKLVDRGEFSWSNFSPDVQKGWQH